MVRQVVATRFVKLYADGSELHYLLDCDSYVWHRKVDPGAPFSEVAINASNDNAAMHEVARISREEYLNHMLGMELHTRC